MFFMESKREGGIYFFLRKATLIFNQRVTDKSLVKRNRKRRKNILSAKHNTKDNPHAGIYSMI